MQGIDDVELALALDGQELLVVVPVRNSSQITKRVNTCVSGSCRPQPRATVSTGACATQTDAAVSSGDDAADSISIPSSLLSTADSSRKTEMQRRCLQETEKRRHRFVVGAIYSRTTLSVSLMRRFRTKETWLTT
eukprot:IDg21643t1